MQIPVRAMKGLKFRDCMLISSVFSNLANYIGETKRNVENGGINKRIQIKIPSKLNTSDISDHKFDWKIIYKIISWHLQTQNYARY